MMEPQPSAIKHQPLEIRPLDSVADFRACEDIQRQVWGPGDAEVVPLNMLLAATRNGASMARNASSSVAIRRRASGRW